MLRLGAAVLIRGGMHVRCGAGDVAAGVKRKLYPERTPVVAGTRALCSPQRREGVCVDGCEDSAG